MPSFDTIKHFPGKLLDEWKLLFRESLLLLRQNAGIITVFVLLHALCSMAILDVSRTVLLWLGMQLTGITYIGMDTILPLFTNPLFLPIIPLYCVVLTGLSVFEISGVLHACAMGKIGMKTSVSGMVSAGFRGCRRALRPKNWLLFLFLFILIPLAGVLSFSTSLVYVAIPGFIESFLLANKLYRWLFRMLCLTLILLQLRYIFSLHVFLLEETDFIPACKKSGAIISHNHLRTIGLLLITSLVTSAVIIGFSAVVSTFGVNITEFFADNFGVLSQTYLSNLLASFIKGFLLALFVPVVTLGILTTLFFQYIEERSSLTKLSKQAFTDSKLSKPTMIGVCIAAVLFCIGFVRLNLYSITNFAENSKRPVIAAHRGDSVRAPENTMPAFKLAIVENADWVELDIHQTKDGVLIVSHDDDLSRVCGQQLYVHDLTYAETQMLDVGSWFSTEYAGTKLSTLDEVLKLYQDTDIRIQIEIKVNGFEDHLEEALLEVINANGLHDRCVIISLSAEPLKRIRELDPTVQTAYCMAIAGDGIEKLDFSTHLTLEQNNYTPQLVERIHEEGKLCFAWTVNDESSIQYLIDCGVDGILTDDPLMLKNALDKADYSGGILRFLRLLNTRLVNGA